MIKCSKCDLNYVKDGDALCSVCINNGGDVLLAIILNISKDFQKWINKSSAHAKLDFDDLDMDMIYNRTRSMWKISDERQGTIKYVLSVIDGVIYGVWKPLNWNIKFDERTNSFRKEFTGIIAEDKVFNNLFGRRIVSLLEKGAQNPVRYFTEKEIEQCPSLRK